MRSEAFWAARSWPFLLALASCGSAQTSAPSGARPTAAADAARARAPAPLPRGARVVPAPVLWRLSNDLNVALVPGSTEVAELLFVVRRQSDAATRGGVPLGGWQLLEVEQLGGACRRASRPDHAWLSCSVLRSDVPRAIELLDAALRDGLLEPGPLGGELADSALLLAGRDLATPEIRATVERTFGTWTADRGPSPAASPPAAAEAGPALVLRHLPSASHVHIELRIAQPARGAVGQEAREVLALLLATSFNSRLAAALREAEASTYAMQASLMAGRSRAALRLAVDVRPPEAVSVLRVLLSTLRASGQGPAHNQPTAEEVGRARSTLRQSLRAACEQSSRSAFWLAEAFAAGLPLDVLPGYAERVERVDAAAVIEEAQRLSTAPFQIEVAGDRSTLVTLRAALSALVDEETRLRAAPLLPSVGAQGSSTARTTLFPVSATKSRPFAHSMP
ncbi:MAG: insulinase family protein [Myxococcales bacterium]|nr:MAG: insulinase family protein [Myxococcales bacterium]